jgi:hypothetical protein
MEEINTLIKPLIYPMCYPDESPIGYLIRLAKINEYDRYQWLLRNAEQLKKISAQNLLYQQLITIEQTGFTNANEIVRELFENNNKKYLISTLRYCPLCVSEYGYLRAVWQIKYAVACLKHQTWLLENCHICGKRVVLTSAKMDECICGADRTAAETATASTEVLLWQAFLEGEQTKTTNRFPLLISSQNSLSLWQRMELLHVITRWVRSLTITTVPGPKKFDSCSGDRIFIEDAAMTLFGGRAGYRAFLLKLMSKKEHDLEYTYSNFSEYCRSVARICQSDELSELQILNDEVVNQFLKKSLTQRNRTFSKELRERHTWISFQAACKKFHIDKSVLRRAMKDFNITHVVHKKDKRIYIDINSSDLEKRLYQIKDSITSKNAAAILGLTKLQFSNRRKTGWFKHMVPPRKGQNSEWQFSRDEILSFLEQYVDPAIDEIADAISLAYVIKHYGAHIEDPLITLLSALRNGDLKIICTKDKKLGIRGLLLSRKEFIAWYERYKWNAPLMTVVQVAKILEINQEFAYQLITFNLLKHQTFGELATKWVSEENLKAFNKKFILLSKFKKDNGLTSNKIITYLNEQLIFPVDHGSAVQLRQKVYIRAQMPIGSSLPLTLKPRNLWE